jgi:hypothetical protein
VKYLTNFKRSINKASIETTRMMSAHLRAEAHASGWPAHIVRGLHVTHSDGDFAVNVHKDHRDEAMNLEYGTPDTQPTAAIRRFNNRQREAEKFLIARASKHWSKI